MICGNFDLFARARLLRCVYIRCIACPAAGRRIIFYYIRTVFFFLLFLWGQQCIIIYIYIENKYVSLFIEVIIYRFTFNARYKYWSYIFLKRILLSSRRAVSGIGTVRAPGATKTGPSGVRVRSADAGKYEIQKEKADAS